MHRDSGDLPVEHRDAGDLSTKVVWKTSSLTNLVKRGASSTSRRHGLLQPVVRLTRVGPPRPLLASSTCHLQGITAVHARPL